MGIRKPIGVCIAALGLGAAVVSTTPAFAGDPPKLKAPVTKGIKPLNPTPTAAPTQTAAPAPTPTTAPAASAKPATSATPAPTTSASAKPATSAVATTPTGTDPSLASLRLASMDARLDALRVRIENQQKTMLDRKKAEQERTRARWGNVVDQPAVHSELDDHAQRVARLQRIQELGIVEGKPAVTDRATVALNKENVRHDQKMATLAAGGGK